MQLLRIYSYHHVSMGLEAEAAVERLRGFVGDEQHAPHWKPAEELGDDTGADPTALVGGMYGNIIERCVILPVAQGPASTDQLIVCGGKACECAVAESPQHLFSFATAKSRRSEKLAEFHWVDAIATPLELDWRVISCNVHSRYSARRWLTGSGSHTPDAVVSEERAWGRGLRVLTGLYTPGLPEGQRTVISRSLIITLAAALPAH